MKRSDKLVVLLFMVFSALLTSAHAESAETVTLSTVFKKLAVEFPSAEKYIVSKNILRSGKENSSQTIIAGCQGRVLKLEVISAIDSQAAEQYAAERRYVLQSLYRRIPSPYPGMITDTIECAPEFKPEVSVLDWNGKKVEVTLVSSTARFTYGACAEDLITYRGGLAFFYAEEKKTLYVLELFIPKDTYRREELLMLMGFFRCQEKPNKNVSRNIIVIGIEPLGARYTKSGGYPQQTTPRLDSFARNAISFTHAISPSGWTLPAFMSWFTAAYPSQHKLVNKYSVYTHDAQELSHLAKLSPGMTTLAQVLKKNGYTTGGFTGGAGVSADFGYDIGFDVYYETSPFGGFDELLPRVRSWLGEKKSGPFFLFVMAYDVHGRYPLAEKTKQKLYAKYKGKYKAEPDDYWRFREKSLDGPLPSLSEEELRFWREWYSEKIRQADQKVGIFLDELDREDLLRNSVVIISAGSGNEFYEHGKFDHGHSLYDEVLRVPFIIKVPFAVPKVIDSLVSTLDIVPTILDILGIPQDEILKKQIQGRSLLPQIQGLPAVDRDIFSETDYLYATFKRSVVASDGWKLIYSMDTGDRELYNLSQDPDERDNQADRDPAKTYELEQKLFSWMSSIGSDRNAHIKLQQRVLGQDLSMSQ